MATSTQVGLGIGGGIIAGLVGYALYDQHKANVKAAEDAQEALGKQIRDAAVADYNSKQATAAGYAAQAEAFNAQKQEILGKQIQTQAQIDYYSGLKQQTERQIIALAAQKGVTLDPSQIQQQTTSDLQMSFYLKMGFGLAFIGAVGYMFVFNKRRRRR